MPGEGGAVVTDDPETARRVRMLRNHGQDGIQRFVHHCSGYNSRFDEVMAKTGLKHSAIYARMSQGTFPKPVPLGPKARGWLLDEVDEWIANRVAERDQQREERAPAAA